MHGVKEVFGAASSTALLYACATLPTLATLVPSLHLSFNPGSFAAILLPRRHPPKVPKKINSLEVLPPLSPISPRAARLMGCKSPSAAQFILGHGVVSVRNYGATHWFRPTMRD